METTNIKEFYESFRKLESSTPEEITVEHSLFEPQSVETTNQSTFSATTNIQKGHSTGNINYLNENSYLNSGLLCNNNSFSNGYIENTNFLPVLPPVEKSQIFSNQCEVRNGNFTYKTSIKFNDRLERVFNGPQNTNILSNCQFSTTSQTYGIPDDKNFISTSFTNDNNQLGSISNNLNTFKTSSPSQTLHNGQVFMQQNEVLQSQYDNYNKTHQYDDRMTHNFRNTNFLRPPTSCQATANKHDPPGNISINIGNISSLLPCQNSPRSNIFTNHCKTASIENNTCTMPVGQYFMNSPENISQNNLIGNDPHNFKNTKKSPITILSQYVFNPNFMANGNFVTANQDKENVENGKHYDQVVGISKIIDNNPLQQFPSMNGNWQKSATNPAININNIKSINVHVHRPSNVSSIAQSVIQPSASSFVDQRVPLVPPQYAPSFNPYPTEVNTVSPSRTIEADYCSDGSRSMSMNQNLSETDYTYESTKDAIRDDIYLPTGEDSSISADIDDWLNTIRLTPLELYTENAATTNISRKSQQVNSSSKSAKQKKKPRARAKINQQALDILKGWFQADQYPNHSNLEIIAEQIGHTVSTVRVWFQNRRQALKKQRDGVIPNTNTAPNLLSTGDQDQQYLTTQLVYSEVEHPTSSNTLQMNDDNYFVQVQGALTAYQDTSFVQ